MKAKRSGLTVIEILVVVGIMALLVGMLLPAVHTVQKMAKETKQKAQFTAIELGLAAFKSDYGDYPPSSWWNPALTGGQQDYCGAQKLSEAMLGWDLLGFHPDSAWRADALDKTGAATTYTAADNLEKRKDRYIDLETASAFLLGGVQDGLFMDTSGTWGGSPLAPRTYVLCDVFAVNERKVLLTGGRPVTAVTPGKMVSPGTPILYYKANPASKTIDVGEPEARIYNARDNWPLISLGRLADTAKPLSARRRHPIEDFDYFYEYIRDPKVHARPWPYRPASYLLISAGMDGIYGTDDDIRYFGR